MQVAETEVEFLSQEILFSSKPYFLRLYLKNEIDEVTVNESTDYDAEKGANAKFSLSHVQMCRRVHDPRKESDCWRALCWTGSGDRAADAVWS